MSENIFNESELLKLTDAEIEWRLENEESL